MKVFIDLHHFDLFYSFQQLFEKRLGWEVYRPIGYEWINQGWNISTYDIVRKGYLSISSGEIEEELSHYTEFSNPEWARFAIEILRVGKIWNQTGGVYLIRDTSKNILQKGITVDEFKKTKFDIIISSVPHHFQPFEELRRKYQPGAKHIFQAGNNWPLTSGVKNLMCSSPVNGAPANTVIYHQEFDLDVFRYNKDEKIDPEIISWVHFPESERLMKEVAAECSSLSFYFRGNMLGPKKDIVIKTRELAEHIKRSTFTWAIKPGGEGYGHIIHNSFACGTPIILSLKDYKGTCAIDLLEDKVTCIDIDNKSVKEIAAAIIRGIPRQQVFDRFKQVVDFDKEFLNIKKFLENLQ